MSCVCAMWNMCVRACGTCVCVRVEQVWNMCRYCVDAVWMLCELCGCCEGVMWMLCELRGPCVDVV